MIHVKITTTNWENRWSSLYNMTRFEEYGAVEHMDQYILEMCTMWMLLSMSMERVSNYVRGSGEKTKQGPERVV